LSLQRDLWLVVTERTNFVLNHHVYRELIRLGSFNVERSSQNLIMTMRHLKNADENNSGVCVKKFF
jgi:hypothetical protein